MSTYVYLPVVGSYIAIWRPDWFSGNSFADGWLEPALQNAGCVSGARTTAVYQTRPFSSSIGLCALALLSQIASVPQYADGCVGGVLCVVGVFASGNAVFDVFVMVLFGVLGYLMRKFGYEPAPLVLAFVLGPMLENNLRKSLILSQGDFTFFIERPISAVCLALAAAVLVAPLLPALARRRARLAMDQS